MRSIFRTEMVHYRKAEVYYNMGELDKAVNLFHTYVESAMQVCIPSVNSGAWLLNLWPSPSPIWKTVRRKP